MPKSLPFTGERFLPDCEGEIAYEHWHRYAFAQRLAAGRKVLDVACGEGYGTNLLAQVATFALGLDVAADAVAHARKRYERPGRCLFAIASCGSLPVAEHSLDMVVSFETIEHVSAELQVAMIAEFDRVLAPDGIVLLSSPNKAMYTDATGYRNEYHVHELYRDELLQLLGKHFPEQNWFAQKIQTLSTLWSEKRKLQHAEAWVLRDERIDAYQGPEALYHLVLMARKQEHLPRDLPSVSLFLDWKEELLAKQMRAQREAIRIDQAMAAQELRLRAIIADRDQQLEQKVNHVAHLERLKAQCEEVVAKRDNQLAASNAHVVHLEELVAERERIVAERDEQLQALNHILLREQQEHGRLVIELREVLLAKADLFSTLSGLEAERAKLLQEAIQLKNLLTRLEQENTQLTETIRQKDQMMQYRQSFRWWIRLPFARLKMAWQKQ